METIQLAKWAVGPGIGHVTILQDADAGLATSGKTTDMVFQGDDMTNPCNNSPLEQFDILNPDLTFGSTTLKHVSVTF